MNINYNKWFYNQHKYLTGNRNSKITFNDTKWINMGKRYNTLINLKSELLADQPYGVMGNNSGFDKLIDLMGKSNYSFEDINDSLIATYKISLKNVMSRNLVNTGVTMFRCTNNDKEHVYSDNFTHYWIIDVPFKQLHFGYRDEFIRQKLHEMHTTENDKYVDITSFTMKEFTRILGFTLICTVNGYFSNDCKVAIDDKGFKFKIGWSYSSDVEFIIYKLDEASVTRHEIPYTLIHKNIISYNELGLNVRDLNGMKCILNIYDKNYAKNVPSVPNFGLFTDEGLVIKNLQNKTLQTIERNNSKNVVIDIYVLKYFYEVPNIFPAVNYYDIMDSRQVFTERYEYVKNVDGNKIVLTNNNYNDLEICTPPISLDRKTNFSFSTIQKCINLSNEMLKYEKQLLTVGEDILYHNSSNILGEFQAKDRVILIEVYENLLKLYKVFQEGAILTSLVTDKEFTLFQTLLENIKVLIDLKNYTYLQQYTFDELYGKNYRVLVNKITKPFANNTLIDIFKNISLNSDYYGEDNTTRFNRPVAEQCFITLRYHKDEECWLFDCPTIKHFKGIGNTFYIDSEINGDELFKFFVLYNDTESCGDEKVNKLSLNDIFDFDSFCEEVDKHSGYIRYWYAENKLMKLCKILYNRYDDETSVQILSKILKKKISGDDIFKIYQSDINYEASNITSDNWDSYDEDSDRSPFALNFLFYTLSMMNGNEDKLQTYFYNSLVNRKFNNRYSDISIEEALDETRFPMSYSDFYVAPNTIPSDAIKTNAISLYYGLPLVINSNGDNVINSYRYTFNVYNTETKYPLISDNDISSDDYVQFENIESYGGMKISYHNEIHLGQLITKYLKSVYDYISELQTNYRISYNQTTLIESAEETIQKHIDKIKVLCENITFENIIGINSNINQVIDSIIENNSFINHISEIKSIIKNITTCTFNGRKTSFIEVINKLLSSFKQVYVTSGFDQHMMKRARVLYINLKKVNTIMNPYEYKKWLNSLDVEFLKDIDAFLATNENYPFGKNHFISYYKIFTDKNHGYITNTIKLLEDLDNLIKDLTISLQEQHIESLTNFCDDIINHLIFDEYILDKIKYDDSVLYTRKPKYVSITINSNPHLKPPIGDQLDNCNTLIFQPIIDKKNNSWIIKSITKICEYIFFNGDTISNANMSIIDENNQIISSQNVSLDFLWIGSSSDVVNTFMQLPNMKNTSLDFENIHESFEIHNNEIINKKHADMNYEMLLGNHFSQLEHTTQLVLQPTTWLQGSVDRLYIPNQKINDMANKDYSHKNCKNVYFKASQVFHIPVDDNNVIESIAGKYFEGQHIYLSTEDGLNIFPVIITAIDHSINKGFIEAKVDEWNARWFEIKDSNMITKYLKENITCRIIDDNIRNFLDEFTDSSYPVYSHMFLNNYDNLNPNEPLPGDPIFVSSNSQYVYNRIIHMFNEVIPNRLMDENDFSRKFIYIASGFIDDNEGVIQINMINHNFNPLSNPEKYPILRDEPNDHEIWENEIKKFDEESYKSHIKEESINRMRSNAEAELAHATTLSQKERLIEDIEQFDRDIKKHQEFQKRMELYKRQLETPTTWYNVRSYETSLVYIANGRADNFSPSIISNIRDLIYSDKLDVFLYDWEHKVWLSPNSYEIIVSIEDSIKVREYDNYSTNKVLHKITIKPKESFKSSKKLLIYFSYKKSDIFNNIPLNDINCSVRFKPLLSLDKPIENYNPYGNIRIRKHFDGYEKYKFDNFNTEDQCYHIKRIKRDGKYTYSPSFRLCDLLLINNENNYDYNIINKLFIPNPFLDTFTDNEIYVSPNYYTTIHSEIDSFSPNQNIKLICISNNENSSYDGNISSVIFNAITMYDEKGEQSISIIDSTIPTKQQGNYVCSVLQDDSYKMTGGVIEINISTNHIKPYSTNGDWFEIPQQYMKYYILPDEFKIQLKDKYSLSNDVSIILQNKYIKNKYDDIISDNSGIYNPFEYYYNKNNETRLPISDVRINSNKTRLIIDQSLNNDISLIKSPYVGICRYSVQRIPEDGFIDLTGYIPTPLSRDRYEFWINGRCLNDKNDLIILSPTSIQLCNMKSLKNFEVIELVDDINTDVDDLFKRGSLYVNLMGKVFSSYKMALLSNSKIIQQDIRFLFNVNLHQSIHDYTKGLIENPNNYDIEEDILSSIKTDNKIHDYNRLYNLPSINGVTIFHPKTASLGLVEIAHQKILKEFDRIWRKETIINPLFTMKHSIDSNKRNKNEIHIKRITDNSVKISNVETKGMFIVHVSGILENYFSLYISTKYDGDIDDINSTMKIIPFISTGTKVIINSKYRGMWLHSTVKSITPKRII